MVTLKQLAELCGVSRGTVDRVVNNRGKVKPEKAEMIRRMAKKLNYQPNPVGKALIASRKNLSAAIVIPSVGIAFFDDVIAALEKAADKYELFGLTVKWYLSRGYEVEEQLRVLEELPPSTNALIINPINDPRIIAKLQELQENGIFVVTLNNDVEQIGHHHYVGPDYYNGGQTAGALMKILNGQPHIFGVTLGSRQLLGHQQRLKGFEDAIKTIPDAEIAAVWEDNDDDIQAYENTRAMLTAHPEIEAVFLASSGGAYGTCRAICSLHRENDLWVIAFDSTKPIIEMMEKGIINAVLYQHPNQQGNRAMQIVYDYLFSGLLPDHEQHIVQNEIRLLPNLVRPIKP